VIRTPPVAGQLPPTDRDPAEVQRLAGEILDHPRYAEPPTPLLDRFWGWVADRIADLFALLTEGGGGTVLAWVLLAVAVAVTALVVVRALGRITRPVGAPEPAHVMVELTRTPAQWRAEAARLAGEGRFAEALACRYRALVGELVARGAIPDAPGRTAREYVGDVAVTRPAAVGAFTTATDDFEATWYGAEPAGPVELDRMAELERSVLAAGSERQPVTAGAP
jgi:hypothetical protein